MKASEVKKSLKELADKSRVPDYQRFFKTGPGEYGEGDIFIGVKVPNIRKVARAAKNLPLKEVEKLLHSPIHEERVCALVILTEQFAAGTSAEQKKIYKFYLANTKHINNWDLVDISAHKIVGAYLYEVPRAEAKKTLKKLAVSKSLWERRIAIIATAFFISKERFGETIGISQMLLKDEHDLIHKGVGWMLREVGNRNREVEERFLRKYYKTMPRTMLRYAIEKFPEPLRKQYLHGKI